MGYAATPFTCLGALRGLGANVSGDTSDDAQGKLLLAIVKDVESGSLTDSKINDYAQTAGAMAAAGGCVAATGGSGAVIAPLCGYVGGKIGGAIASLFGASEPKPNIQDHEARYQASVAPLCDGDPICAAELKVYANSIAQATWSPVDAYRISTARWGAGAPGAIPGVTWGNPSWASFTPTTSLADGYAWSQWVPSAVAWFQKKVAIAVAASKLRRERAFLQSVLAYRQTLLKTYLRECPPQYPSCQTEIGGIVSQWAMATKAANERGLQLYAGRSSYTDASYRAEVEGKIRGYWEQVKAKNVADARAGIGDQRVLRTEGQIAASASTGRKLAIAGVLVGAAIVGLLAIRKNRVR